MVSCPRNEAVAALGLVWFAGGCVAFRYACDRPPAPETAPERAWRVGVRPLRNVSTVRLYVPPYGAVLAEPVEDLSCGLAAALKRSGTFAEVVYLPDGAAEPAGLDAVLSGEITHFRFDQRLSAGRGVHPPGDGPPYRPPGGLDSVSGG